MLQQKQTVPNVQIKDEFAKSESRTNIDGKGSIYQLRQNTKQPSALKEYVMLDGKNVPPLKRRSKTKLGQPRDNGGKFISFKPSGEPENPGDI